MENREKEKIGSESYMRYFRESPSSRGYRAEFKVGFALSILMERELIAGFAIFSRGSEPDKAGKDFEIYTNEGDSFCLQVKAGRADLRKFKKAHPDIPVFIPDISLSDENIADKLSEAFNF